MLPDIERDECRSCGQQVLGERDASGLFRCFHCLEASRASQGVQDRLFEPVAAPMRGQLAHYYRCPCGDMHDVGRECPR